MRARHLKLPFMRNEIRAYVQRAGLLRFVEIGDIAMNQKLISALVERWRPETHTFHFPCGECTITLEDVAIILGLSVNGRPVIGSTVSSYETLPDLCQYLLGVRPGPLDVSGGAINLIWLNNSTGILEANSDLVIQQLARAFILALLGQCILPDKSTGEVHAKYLQLLEDLEQVGSYSWGSACLAVLFRGLCRATRKATKEINGCIILLQVWAWQRMPFLAPIPSMPVVFPLCRRWKRPRYPRNINLKDHHNIRLLIDNLGHQFVWQPYIDPLIDALIPDDVRAERQLFSSVTSLLCFEVMELHPTDRVMRQFGFNQEIPIDQPNLQGFHNRDLRGLPPTNWERQHQHWVAMWLQRANRVLMGTPTIDYQPSDLYWSWYLSHTRAIRLSPEEVDPPPAHEENEPPLDEEGQVPTPGEDVALPIQTEVPHGHQPLFMQQNINFYWDVNTLQFPWSPQMQQTTQIQDPPRHSVGVLGRRSGGPTRSSASSSSGRMSVHLPSGPAFDFAHLGGQSSTQVNLDLNTNPASHLNDVYRPQMFTFGMSIPQMLSPGAQWANAEMMQNFQDTAASAQHAAVGGGDMGDEEMGDQGDRDEGGSDEDIGDEGGNVEDMGDEGGSHEGMGDQGGQVRRKSRGIINVLGKAAKQTVGTIREALRPRESVKPAKRLSYSPFQAPPPHGKGKGRKGN